MRPTRISHALPRRVVVSYARRDRRYMRMVRVHLRAYELAGTIDLFVDESLNPGELWEPTLRTRFEQADVAILLVTPRFIASPYIRRVELPMLLAQAEGLNTTLAWFPISPSAVETTRLVHYQAAWEIDRHLTLLRSRGERDLLLDQAMRRLFGGRRRSA